MTRYLLLMLCLAGVVVPVLAHTSRTAPAEAVYTVGIGGMT